MLSNFESKRSANSPYLDRFRPRLDRANCDSPGNSASKARADSQRKLDYDVLSPAGNLLRYGSRDARRGENFSFDDSASPGRLKHEERGHAALEPKPVRTLPAPALLDDYYLNLLEWSAANVIGLGLDSAVSYHSFHTNETSRGFDVAAAAGGSSESIDAEPPPHLCALGFDRAGAQCALGDSRGTLYITDVATGREVTRANVHAHRIGALHWQNNLLATGSRDSLVRLFDVRCSLLSPITAFSGHQQEVCGLKLSPAETLLASGGNDNLLNLWDVRQMRGLASLGAHEAAVKAIAWHPKQASLLVSGAGTADRCIRVFDAGRLEERLCVDTEAQVCSVAFDADGQHLVSTHGYSLNQLMLWEHGEALTKLDCLIAHKVRVLYLALSPCGKYAATAAGDESLRVWKIARPLREAKKAKSIFSSQAMNIR